MLFQILSKSTNPHKRLSKKCRSFVQKNDIRAGSPCWRLAMSKTLAEQTFVQKLLIESGCRMSQRRDDFCS
jgi:hypothetical protein